MKRLAILGSTGSIGTKALEIISHFPNEFRIIGLSANTNIELLERQIREFKPIIVGVRDEVKADELKKRDGCQKLEICGGIEGLSKVASHQDVDLAVIAISGSTALLPTLDAISSGKKIALANKESLVMAGKIIMERARQKGVDIIPIDSEHSAIFQCLNGRRDWINRIYLTSSGGPMVDLPKERFSSILPQQALKHPKWKMGRKVSIDSSTLMNKGLEAISTRWLFGIEIGRIVILLHREAVVHSMIEFIDGTILAQLAITDMRLPIQYALSYPERWPTPISRLDLFSTGRLTFASPDFGKFPCLNLALEAAQSGGSAPCALNAANEVAVEAFLENRIPFLKIPKVIEKLLSRHHKIEDPTLDEILNVDRWAREETEGILARCSP